VHKLSKLASFTAISSPPLKLKVQLEGESTVLPTKTSIVCEPDPSNITENDYESES